VSIDGEAGYVIVILSGQRYQKATRINRPGNVSLLGYSLFVSILLVPTILGIAAVLLVTLRFRKMTHVVAAFSKGDYTLRITDRSSDELGVYARAFDQMADTIVESMEALKVQDELRRQLIANVSHELRRPLSLMSLSLETLLEGNSSWSEQLRSEYIEQAIVGNEQMARLVADLFELSKLQASESPPHVETFELDELIDDVIAKFARLAGSKGLTLTSSSPEEIPHVLADLRLIDRVLSNLIENAIHHSPAGGEILITLTPGERAVEVRISDQGAGIPAEELPHIFERFYRGGQTGIQDSGGAGLGLAIVKRILEMHDQSISVESVPGEGCHFSFFLRYSETQAL
jgi:signal transduction histidine kinase